MRALPLLVLLAAITGASGLLWSDPDSGIVQAAVFSHTWYACSLVEIYKPCRVDGRVPVDRVTALLSTS